MKISAVVLAAGRSQRMGCQKMTLPWGETTVIGQVVKVLLSAGVDDVLVVTGGARCEIERALAGLSAHMIFNPNFANGEMTKSLQVGLAALENIVVAALVVLGDQPQIEPSVVRSVVAGFEPAANVLVIPSFQRRRGHPWLMPRVLWDDFMELSTNETMRHFLDRYASDIHYVDVETPSILQDLDTPEDYQRYQSPDK